MVHLFADGTRLDFTADEVGPVSLTNIVRSLGTQFMLGGQSVTSVLQHSLMLGRMVEVTTDGDPKLVQAAYCRYFSNAIVGEMSLPVQDMLGGDWGRVRDLVQRKLMRAFGLPDRITPEHQAILNVFDNTLRYTDHLETFGMVEADRFVEDTPGFNLSALYVYNAACVRIRVAQVQIWDNQGGFNPEIVANYRKVILSHLE